MPEIVASSKTSLPICENNMAILRLLSEEIFDFSAGSMTSAKADTLKAQMVSEFSEVFRLCSEVLEKAQKPSLIKATLDTTLRFITWVPLGFIFETTFMDTLLGRFLEHPDYRNVTLKCLSETTLVNNPEYDPQLLILFQLSMSAINRMLPPTLDLAQGYEDGSDEDQELINNLAIFITTFLTHHLKLIENDEHRLLLENAHGYLLKISMVPEREIFKICLEYWSKLTQEFYDEMRKMPVSNPILGLNLGGAFGGGGNQSEAAALVAMRKTMYAEILSSLRLVMIERMVKPEEVLIVENDEGEIVREVMKESDAMVMYKSMRSVLVYLTHLDPVDTENIMTDKLTKQVDGSEWGWNPLNTLCWAIGSISGAMSEDSERRFLVTVIRDLLTLCEAKKGKDNKAVVASNIMYIVGQYPRFLRAHWKFLKTVVNKNFEFMHETHEGVQDMACDTFLKIAQKCRRHFIIQQAGEAEPFVDEILRSLHFTTNDLSPSQVHTFYEAVGFMISAQTDQDQQERLIAKLMELPNSAWTNVLEQARANVDVFSSPENIKVLANVLKTNVAACTSIGAAFLPQLGRIYLDMLQLYKSVSTIISTKVETEGLIATKTPMVRGLRTIKKEILRLVETYVSRATDLEYISSSMIPTLLEAVLGDYANNVPDARDAEVLNVMAAITNKLGALLLPQIQPTIDAVFEPTLAMISLDFSEFPEHRVGFFRLLRAITENCFEALLTLPPEKFRLTMDSIIWAIKHTMRDIADQGLAIMLELLDKMQSADASVAQAFYQTYLLAVLRDVFAVLTDSDHKSGFGGQSLLLAKLFELVQTGAVLIPLGPEVEAGQADNKLYVQQYTATMLHNAFPNMDPAYIDRFVTELFVRAGQVAAYKQVLRDFLILSREQSGVRSDHADLYVDDKEAQAAAELQKAGQVPGMLKPSQMKDEDEEL